MRRRQRMARVAQHQALVSAAPPTRIRTWLATVVAVQHGAVCATTLGNKVVVALLDHCIAAVPRDPEMTVVVHESLQRASIVAQMDLVAIAAGSGAGPLVHAEVVVNPTLLKGHTATAAASVDVPKLATNCCHGQRARAQTLGMRSLPGISQSTTVQQSKGAERPSLAERWVV